MSRAEDVWDGTATRPAYDAGRGGLVITKGSELAYAHQHWIEEAYDGVAYCNSSYFLDDNLDLSAHSWTPMGQGKGDALQVFQGTFYGNGLSINLTISGAKENYQGLFAEIGAQGRVQDLHVSGRIECSDSRLVGGIAGQNVGTIFNCWVSADVISHWRGISNTAKVGGITGENQGGVYFCCMTGDVLNDDADVGGIVGYNPGIINHCTFYGSRYSTHDQDNIYVGDQTGKLWNAHEADLLDDATLANYLATFSSTEGCDLYRFAIQYPDPINIYCDGYGALETEYPGTRMGKTVRLTKAFGSLRGITIINAYGENIAPSGNETDGYTFAVPRRGVIVQATFSGNHWLANNAGTQDDPYRIRTTDDWNAFAFYVRKGYNFYQQYVKLESDITIATSVGMC